VLVDGDLADADDRDFRSRQDVLPSPNRVAA